MSTYLGLGRLQAERLASVFRSARSALALAEGDLLTLVWLPPPDSAPGPTGTQSAAESHPPVAPAPAPSPVVPAPLDPAELAAALRRELERTHLRVVTEKRPYLGFEEAARYLDLTVDALRKRVERDQIPIVRIGESIRFDLDKIDAFLAETACKPASAAEPEPDLSTIRLRRDKGPRPR